jgi:hypothetical protein
MVYRAIAKLNSAEHVSVLDEIYQGLDHSGEPVRDFYWTIRGMSGLGALELRSKIRDEVGMEELR